MSRRNTELLFLVIAGAVSTMAYVSVYAGRYREINRVSLIYGLIFVAIFIVLHLWCASCFLRPTPTCCR